MCQAKMYILGVGREILLTSGTVYRGSSSGRKSPNGTRRGAARLSPFACWTGAHTRGQIRTACNNLLEQNKASFGRIPALEQ